MHNYRDGDIDLPMTLTNDHSKAMWGAENGSPLKKVVFDKPNLSKRKGGHKKGEQEILRFSLQHIKINSSHIRIRLHFKFVTKDLGRGLLLTQIGYITGTTT